MDRDLETSIWTKADRGGGGGLFCLTKHIIWYFWMSLCWLQKMPNKCDMRCTYPKINTFSPKHWHDLHDFRAYLT